MHVYFHTIVRLNFVDCNILYYVIGTPADSTEPDASYIFTVICFREFDGRRVVCAFFYNHSTYYGQILKSMNRLRI